MYIEQQGSVILAAWDPEQLDLAEDTILPFSGSSPGGWPLAPHCHFFHQSLFLCTACLPKRCQAPPSPSPSLFRTITTVMLLCRR